MRLAPGCCRDFNTTRYSGCWQLWPGGDTHASYLARICSWPTCSSLAYASMHAHSTHALMHTQAPIQQKVEQATSWTDCPVPRSLWLHAFYVVSLILWGAEERSGKLPHRLKLSSSFMKKKKSKLSSSLTKLMGKSAGTWL